VINGGIFGWSTRQEYLFYETHGTELDPDLVLIGLVLNDIIELKQGIESTGGAGSLAAINALSWLAQRTATVRIMKQIYVATAAPQARAIKAVEDLEYKANSPEVRRAIDLVGTELLRVAELAHLRGDRFGIVLFPFSFQFENSVPAAPQQRLTAFAEQSGIPVLDTLPTLRAFPPNRVLMDEDHFTPEGHQVVARAVASWIDRESLLPTAQARYQPERP
jgi:lysophospholipase L1-like esterase